MIPFFDDADNLKKHMSVVVSDISLESLESYAKSSMEDIALITGSDILEGMWERFLEGDTTDDDDVLIAKILKPIANMTFYRHSEQATLQVTDTGYNTEEGANIKKPYQWMMRDFKRQCLKAYAEGMAELWKFVVENIETYEDIYDSDEYQYLKKRPINQLNQWQKAGRRIADWRTHYALCAEMNNVWEDMSSFISAELVAEVDSYLLDEGANEDIEALLPYLRRYLAHATIYRGADNLPISIEAGGLIIYEVASNKDNSVIEKQDRDKRFLKKQAYEDMLRGQKRLIEFLNANATADKYVGFYDAYIKDAAPFVMNTTENKIIVM